MAHPESGMERRAVTASLRVPSMRGLPSVRDSSSMLHLTGESGPLGSAPGAPLRPLPQPRASLRSRFLTSSLKIQFSRNRMPTRKSGPEMAAYALQWKRPHVSTR